MKSGKILRSQSSPFVKLDGIGFGSTVFAPHSLDSSLDHSPLPDNGKIRFTREVEICSESDADEEEDEDEEEEVEGYYDVMTASSPDTSSTSELSFISEGEEDVTIQCGGTVVAGTETNSKRERERESSAVVLVEWGVAY